MGGGDLGSDMAEASLVRDWKKLVHILARVGKVSGNECERGEVVVGTEVVVVGDKVLVVLGSSRATEVEGKMAGGGLVFLDRPAGSILLLSFEDEVDEEKEEGVMMFIYRQKGSKSSEGGYRPFKI